MSKILYLDIETAPNLGWVWGMWEQNVIDFEQITYILCFGYQWEGQKSPKVIALPDFKTFKKDKTDDTELMKELWELLDEADVVVAHNGDQFDIKKINTRFVVNGLNPPSPYKTVDTKKVAKSKFGFNSNKLDLLANDLGLGRKIAHTGFKDTWLKCMDGDKTAWKTMKRYNKQDIVLLRDVYLALRPWMTNHPNMNLLNGEDINCPKCESDKLQRRGYSFTNVNKYQRVQCQECGGWSRFRLAELNHTGLASPCKTYQFYVPVHEIR